MNIAIVTPYSWAHPGGVNNHVQGLAAQMTLRGHRVTVIAPDRGGEMPGVHYESAGRSVPIPANGSIARVAVIPGAGRRVGTTLRKGEFDVVHVHEPFVPLAATAAVRAAPCRVVATFHSAGGGRPVQYNIARVCYRGVDRRIDCRIAVSPSAMSLVSRYFPGRYEIVPNGVDLGRFTPGLERPREFSPGGPVVLFVGRNEPRKGLDILLEAFGKVSRDVPGCRLMLVGSGLDSPELLRGVDEDVRGRITATGFVSNSDLPAFYAAADLFCAPALGGESFGVILLEAMAAGTPVVASDIPGYSDVVSSAGGGILFETGNAGKLAQRLIELIADERLRGELADAGLAGVKEFSWEVLATRLEQLYFP